MKLLRIILINLCIQLGIGSVEIYAQVNLVPNPSFEVYDTCPSAFISFTNRTIYYAIPWFQPFIPENSTDYFNACNNDTNLRLSVPLNYDGYQLAKTGVAYVGFITGYIIPQNNYREYLEVELLDSLIPNKKYCVSYYINFANKSKRATDGFGAYLSNSAVLYSSPPFSVLNNLQPQIENSLGNVVDDTLNWVEISGDFTAIGGEKYITIGNFRDDAHTTMIQNNYGSFLFSYYYIDDVSVIYCDSNVGLNENEWESNISISQNPVKDIIYFKNLPAVPGDIFIYDLQGKLLINQKLSSVQTSQTVNISELSAGVYFVKIITEKGSVTRKIIKE